MTSPVDSTPATSLRITAQALELVDAYVQLVCEEYGAQVESMGFLLAEKCDDGPSPIVTDVVLAHDQTVSAASVRVSPSGVLASGREIERRGGRCVGWYHAHPGATFHSGTDDENLEIVLNDVAASQRQSVVKKEPATAEWDAEALVIRTGTETVRMVGKALKALRRKSTSDRGGPPLEVEIERHAAPEIAAYSLVLSATGESPPYAEMAVAKCCRVCGHRSTEARRVSIEIVDPEALDLDSMRAEMKHKVRVPRFHALAERLEAVS